MAEDETLIETLTEIKEIREGNNDLWMKILHIAMEHAPEKTRSVLAVIKSNDEDIAYLLGRL